MAPLVQQCLSDLPCTEELQHENLALPVMPVSDPKYDSERNKFKQIPSLAIHLRHPPVNAQELHILFAGSANSHSCPGSTDMRQGCEYHS